MATFFLPERHKVYTMREVIETLMLKDSPFFMFYHLDVESVIQTSHLTEAELLSVPGIADTLWRYVRTTHEWIPVFHWVDNNPKPITEFCDLKKTMTYAGDDDWWTTPKGFPRDDGYEDFTEKFKQS